MLAILTILTICAHHVVRLLARVLAVGVRGSEVEQVGAVNECGGVEGQARGGPMDHEAVGTSL